MKNRAYEDLENWEQAFHDLNMKLGNEVWGACLERDVASKTRMRVFIHSEGWKEKVLQETSGRIVGYPLVFTVRSQDEYNQKLVERENAKEE